MSRSRYCCSTKDTLVVFSRQPSTTLRTALLCTHAMVASMADKALREHVHAWLAGEVDVDYTRLAQRFWAKVSSTPDNSGCREWLGSRDTRGHYGRFTIKAVPVYAHRVAYRLARGPIIKGMTIDHDRDKGCSNSLCCEPTHLTCVSVSENSKRTRNLYVFT